MIANKEEAIDFLKAHQPLPPDKELSEEEISDFDTARKIFLNDPDPVCVPLFLQSFGDGDGLGVYPLIGDVILSVDREQIIPHLTTALRSSQRGVAYWSAQIAARTPDSRLVAPLKDLLMVGDRDSRYVAITALEQIGGAVVRRVLESHLATEGDDELRALVDEVLTA